MSDVQHESTERQEESGQDNWFTPHNPEFPYAEAYKPLDRNKNEIRLVRVLAGSGADPIHCEVHDHLSLPIGEAKTDLGYEAVSYCAGDPRDCNMITLNGHPFNIFRSLYGALWQFRHADADCLLWIDQVCINQADTSERESQVLLMRHVYQRASRTLVWLGDAEPHDDLAFDAIEEFHRLHGDGLLQNIETFRSPDNPRWRAIKEGLNLFREDLAEYLTSETLWFEDLASKPPEAVLHSCQAIALAFQWLMALHYDPKGNLTLRSLDTLLNRKWWGRCWVLQEVVVSENIDLFSGSQYVSWERFSLLGLMVIFSFRAAGHLSTFPSNQNVTRFATVRAHAGALSLYYTLITSRPLLASDDRDKVYSLLGLVKPSSDGTYGIEPSYISYNTTQDVFRAAAKVVILKDRELNFLGNVSGHEKDFGLPSWVPCWSKPEIHYGHWNVGGMPRPSAGGGIIFDPQIEENDMVLRVSAFIVDPIDVFCPTPESRDELRELIQICKSRDVSLAQIQLVTGLEVEALEHLIANEEQYFSVRGVLKTDRVGVARALENFGVAKVFFTQYGTIGSAPTFARLGDIVCVIPDSDWPLLIRPTDRTGYYNNVSKCIVAGYMNGEIREVYESGEAELVDIRLE